MEKFIVDGNNQRIIRIKDENLGIDIANFAEAYVQYSIPFRDNEDLVMALKANGDIKPEIKEVQVKADTEGKTIYDGPQQQLDYIMLTQGNMLDKQLGIIIKLMDKQ